MKRTLTASTLLAALVVAAGCAAEPTEQIRSAAEAYQRASTPEVEEYAPDSLRAARDTKAQLDAELAAQQEKFALLRSYKKVEELAAATTAASERAQADAQAAREQARADAATAIDRTLTLLTEAREMLAVAPAGKGTQADMMLYKADLDAVEAAVNEAQAAFDAGRYHEARAKADAAGQSAERVKGDLERAKEARQKARA
jgi:hypothetical protein